MILEREIPDESHVHRRRHHLGDTKARHGHVAPDGRPSYAVGISVPEMLALEYLDPDGSIGPSEPARRLQVTSGAMTALVDRVGESGHVVRERHPGDRRRGLVKRTRKADEDLTAEIAPISMRILELAESLDGAERQAVGRFFDGFIAIVERTAAEACER